MQTGDAKQRNGSPGPGLQITVYLQCQHTDAGQCYQETNGNDDAYIFEAGQMVVYTYDEGSDTGAFVGTGSLYDYDGQLGNFQTLVGEE